MENGGFLCKSFFLVDPSPLGVLFFFFWRKVRFFTCKFYTAMLVGHFCCILCKKEKEDFDHILSCCKFVSSV